MTDHAPDPDHGREITRSLSQFAGLLWDAAGTGARPPLHSLLRAAGYAADESRRVVALLAATNGEQPRLRALLRAAGYTADEARRVEALLSATEGERPEIGAVMRVVGYAAAEARKAQTVLAAAQGERPKVRKLLRAVGYPADEARRVEALLATADGERPDLRTLLRAAGYAADDARRVEAVLAGGDRPELRVLLRAAGYTAGEAHRVATLIAQADAAVDAGTVKRTLRAAGYSKGATAQALRLLESDDAELQRFLRAWGQTDEDDNDLRAQLRVVLSRGDVGPDEVAAVLRAAGYPRGVIERFLAPVVEVEDPDLRRLRRAWESGDLGAQLRMVLARGEVGPDEVTTVLRAAGYSRGVIERFLNPVVEEEDPDLRRLRRAWGPPGADGNDVGAQLQVVLGRGEVGPDEVTTVLRAAGYSRRVIDRFLNPVAEGPPDLRRALLASGYPKAVIGLVLGILARFEDSEETSSGLQVRDIAAMIESADDNLLGLVRGWASRDEPHRLRNELRSVLGRHELDLELAGAFAAIATPGSETGDVALQRVLRAAGTRSDLGRLIGKLLQRFEPGAEVVSPSVRDIADFIDTADDDLLGLLRTWRNGDGDRNRVRAQLRSLLRHQGFDAELAGSVAGLVLTETPEVELAEVMRIGRLAKTAEDALVSIAEPSWLEDPRFADAYAEAKRIAAWGRDIRWRVQTLVKLAAAATHHRGDFVECGVDTGGTARAVMAYLGDDAFAGRRFFLFDTFHGMVPEQLTEEEQVTDETRGDRYPDVSEVVRSNFADKPYVRIVQGAVPDTLVEYDGERVAFLHIDMNATVPEVGALRHFWPKLAPGAAVVFDDYGFPRHAPQRRALDAVAAELGVEIIMLPTCQGLLLKPAGPAGPED